jgi:hypothetical protein
MDVFFKEQIESLDRSPLPGSQWNPDASWEKISANTGSRKKIIFWWYYNGAAAIILLLVGFWIINQSLHETDSRLATKSIDLENNNIGSAQNQETGTANSTLAETLPTQNTATTNSNNITKKSVIEPAKTPLRREKNNLSQLEYLDKSITLTTSNTVPMQPMFITSTDLDAETKNDLAFNRTYIIKKNKDHPNTNQTTGNDLKLRIDLAAKSSTGPPVGILAGLAK